LDESQEVNGPILVCMFCGSMVLLDKSKLRIHRSGGLGIEIRTCADEYCATQSLCATNVYGIHGEVITLDDDLGGGLWPDDLPLPPQDLWHQFGTCSNCKEPMTWDVGRQRWRDFRE